MDLRKLGQAMLDYGWVVPSPNVVDRVGKALTRGEAPSLADIDDFSCDHNTRSLAAQQPLAAPHLRPSLERRPGVFPRRSLPVDDPVRAQARRGLVASRRFRTRIPIPERARPCASDGPGEPFQGLLGVDHARPVVGDGNGRSASIRGPGTERRANGVEVIRSHAPIPSSPPRPWSYSRPRAS